MARRPTTKPTSNPVRRGILHGYRSGLEERIAEELAKAGVQVNFEGFKFHYVQPAKARSYTPDWPLPNGIVVETKGRFLTEDRQKHKLLKAQHSDLDIRFVFSNSKTKLSKGSPTTYADWCRQYGFQFADKSIPATWLNEPPCSVRLAAIERAAAKPAKAFPSSKVALDPPTKS